MIALPTISCILMLPTSTATSSSTARVAPQFWKEDFGEQIAVEVWLEMLLQKCKSPSPCMEFVATVPIQLNAVAISLMIPSIYLLLVPPKPELSCLLAPKPELELELPLDLGLVPPTHLELPSPLSYPP